MDVASENNIGQPRVMLKSFVFVSKQWGLAAIFDDLLVTIAVEVTSLMTLFVWHCIIANRTNPLIWTNTRPT
jgi:hypothetical protein